MTEILTHSVCNFLNFTLLFTLNGKDAPFVCIDVRYFTIKRLKLFFVIFKQCPVARRLQNFRDLAGYLNYEIQFFNVYASAIPETQFSRKMLYVSYQYRHLILMKRHVVHVEFGIEIVNFIRDFVPNMTKLV